MESSTGDDTNEGFYRSVDPSLPATARFQSRDESFDGREGGSYEDDFLEEDEYHENSMNLNGRTNARPRSSAIEGTRKRKRSISRGSGGGGHRHHARPSGSDDYDPEEDQEFDSEDSEEDYDVDEDSDAGDSEEEAEIEYTDEDEDDGDRLGQPKAPKTLGRASVPGRSVLPEDHPPKEARGSYPPPLPPSTAETSAQRTGLKVKLRIPKGAGEMHRSSSMASMTGGSTYARKGQDSMGNDSAGASRFSTPTESEVGGTAASDVDASWGEWDEEKDEEMEAREEAAKRRRRLPAVLLTDEELANMDDEVEKVLAHRDPPGATVSPTADPWKSREFYVKWARFSYIHCSWDSYATLAQLGGFKRVLNYCRKIDLEAVERLNLGAEEREAADVRRAMQEELEREYTEVDRIIAERKTPLIALSALHQFSGKEALPGEDGAVDLQTEGNESAVGFAGNVASGSSTQYLCKWQGLPYSDATWEIETDVVRIGGQEAIDDYHRREKAAHLPCKSVDVARRVFRESGESAFVEQPTYLKGGQLRDYQLASLNWMIYNWSRGVNGILADEMGLGKTVQCASFAGYLTLVQRLAAPTLVIVPLSTVPNWMREFRKWIPEVNTVLYVGDAASRKVVRRFEFPPPGVDHESLSACGTEWTGRNVVAGERPFKFDVLVTTYELALKDAELLREIEWGQLMVDEAHRLKNDESALYKELSSWKFRSKLLVTGTPLQNNLRELWALLSFLHPEKFPSSEEFESQHDPNDPAGVQRLHSTLRPHLLRRVIKDVEKSLPPKNERILRVPMTPLQKQYYRWILTRNFTELNRGAKGAQVTLLNIISDLKKCCNHPFLFETARENYRVPSGVVSGTDDVAASLVLPSGKMVLLDKLLRRLRETGHRVLIFSQMVRVLDIMSEYMRARGYQFQRLDGSTPAHLRHRAMEQFNAPGSQDFAFLLSTRAGGLGINLATADTVLLFDSDWNPQNDLQAMSRAHRIGQKDIVNIYRLVTSGSVEEDILERAKRKMVLDHVVIQRMDTSGRTILDPNQGAAATSAGARMFKKDELAAILKFGAEDLFKEDHEGEQPTAAAPAGGGMMTDEDLDAILERAEVVEQREGEGTGGASDLLASFNVATFKADEDDAAFWSKLIPEDRRPKDEPTNDGLAAGTSLGDTLGIRTTRLRALEASHAREALHGTDNTHRSKARKRGGQSKDEPGPKVDGALLRIDTWPQAVDASGRLIASETAPRPLSFPKTLGKRDAAAFVKAVRRHGLASKLETIAEDAGGAVATASLDAVEALFHGLMRGCEKVLDIQSKRAPPPSSSASKKKQAGKSHVAAQRHRSGGSRTSSGGHSKEPEAHLDFFGVDVRAGDLLSLLRHMKLLESKAKTSIGPDGRLRLTIAERPVATTWMRACGWTPEEDAAVLLGVLRHGIGAWDRIADDKELRLGDKLAVASGRLPSQDRPELPRSSHLETRVLGLLRQIEKVSKKSTGNVLGSKQQQQQHQTSRKTRGSTVMRLPKPSPAELEARSAAASNAEASLGQEAMKLVRKLRTLQRRGAEMETSLVVNKTRKYMTSIGDTIDEVASEAAARTSLWQFVSEYTENAMTGPQMENLYRRLKKAPAPQSPTAKPVSNHATEQRQGSERAKDTASSPTQMTEAK